MELTEGNSDAFDCSADVGGNGLTATKGSPDACSTGTCTEDNCCYAAADTTDPPFVASCGEVTDGGAAFDCSADVGGNGLTAAKGSPEDCSGACTEANCCEAPAQARLRRRAQDFAATCGEETDGGAAYTCTAGTADASATATECTAGTCDDAQCCEEEEEEEVIEAFLCECGEVDADDASVVTWTDECTDGADTCDETDTLDTSDASTFYVSTVVMALFSFLW